ncbi:MAG: ATP-binding protein, partial [Caulobacteraceae bacterium]
MRKKHHPPFQARVASVAIVTTVAVLAAACVTFMVQQWTVAREESRLTYSTLASVVATSAAPSLASGDEAGASAALAAAARQSGFVDARLANPAGRVVARFAAQSNRERAGGPYQVVRREILLAGKPVGEVVLRARPPALADILPRFLALTFALFFGASGIALFVAQGLARRVTAPVERLSSAMAAVAASGEFTPVAETADDDVFHRLT